MNPSQLEQLLLLEQSGELAPKQRRALDAELAASAEARHLRAALRGLANAIPPPPGQPSSPAAAAQIASRLAQPLKRSFAPAAKSALAAAAALALLLGVRAYLPNPANPSSPPAQTAAALDDEWTDPYDADFAELESLLASISTDDALDVTDL